MTTTFGLFNTSVMGMSAQSDALAVISENIANSGTVGYKQATTQFLTVMSGVQGAEVTGGGVSTRIRYNNAAQGAVTRSSSATDVAIKGKGFFVVSDGSGGIYLTRAGSFVPDANGRLVNAAGYYLMGFDVNKAPTTSATNALTSMEIIQIEPGKAYASPTTKGKFGANIPAGATNVAGADLPSTNSSTAKYNAKTSLTVYDNLGTPIQLDLYFSKTAANSWELTIYNNANAASGGGFPYTAAALVTQTLTFSSADGSLTSGNPVSLTVPGGAAMSLDISSVTQLSTSFGVNTIEVNGNAAGAVQSVEISPDGFLSYKLSNGLPLNMFKIGLANVNSPTNLVNVTGNVYTVSPESGQIMVGDPGAAGFGALESNALENSTVDLASELSSMIIAQRSYTANTQVFQVASEVLQVLNNLK